MKAGLINTEYVFTEQGTPGVIVTFQSDILTLDEFKTLLDQTTQHIVNLRVGE